MLLAELNIYNAELTGDPDKIHATHIVETVRAVQDGIAGLRRTDGAAAARFDAELKAIGTRPVTKGSARDDQLKRLVDLGERLVARLDR